MVSSRKDLKLLRNPSCDSQNLFRLGAAINFDRYANENSLPPPPAARRLAPARSACRGFISFDLKPKQKDIRRCLFVLSMGYEKDGFAFLIDGFEPSKPFSSREKGLPPRLMTVAIRRGGKCGGGMKQSQELSNFKSSDEDYFDSIFGFDNHALKYLSHNLIVIADRVIY